jgi:hypothetical protein
MDDFREKMLKLRETCLACWAKEFSGIFPQSINKKIARKEYARYGSPPCKCKKNPAK